MRTTYGRGRRNTQRKDRGQKKEESARQLVQLLLCLAVFLAVFIGKGVWPSKVARTGEQLLAVIRSNTDFQAAFAGLGKTLSEHESVLGELGEFCISVFAPSREESELSTNAHISAGEQSALTTDTSQTGAIDPEYIYEETEVKAESQQLKQTVFRVGDVVQDVEEQGHELPEGYSAQWLYLGDMETAVPVLGTVTSEFGYRDHPTIGRYAAHGGVDIAADTGAPVAAFAEGTVETVGENEDFGRYLELSHPNGVTTFYSHCSKICVGRGDEVQAGQTIALVGNTGKSTGPHLHFEVRLNGVRLDPMYYIEPGQVV